MRRLSLIVGFIALTALACEDPSSSLPTTPAPPGAASVELSGPETIAPGQSVQLTVSVRLADGTVKSAAPSTPLTWISSNPQVLSVSAGLARASQQRGEAVVTVRYGTGNASRQASRNFLVLPDGTFRLVGTVRDAEGLTFPLSGARLEATPGSAVATTDSEGRYRLYGVPADSVIQVSRAGYATASQAVHLTTHASRDFHLTLSGTRVTISGLYTFVLDMNGGCSGPNVLNADLQRRVYDATVTQNGPTVDVLLTEPRFRLNSINRGNRFQGFADASGVRFTLDPYWSYYYPYYGPTSYPNIAERLPNGSFLVPQGVVNTTGSAAGLTGMMTSAYVANYDSRFPASNTNILGHCESPQARFTLTPR